MHTLEQPANLGSTSGDTTSDKWHRELELLKEIPKGFMSRLDHAENNKVETAVELATAAAVGVAFSYALKTPGPLTSALKIGAALEGGLAATAMTLGFGESAIDAWQRPQTLERDKSIWNMLGGMATFDMPLMALAGGAAMKGLSMNGGRFALTPKEYMWNVPAVPVAAVLPAQELQNVYSHLTNRK